MRSGRLAIPHLQWWGRASSKRGVHCVLLPSSTGQLWARWDGVIIVLKAKRALAWMRKAGISVCETEILVDDVRVVCSMDSAGGILICDRNRRIWTARWYPRQLFFWFAFCRYMRRCYDKTIILACECLWNIASTPATCSTRPLGEHTNNFLQRWNRVGYFNCSLRPEGMIDWNHHKTSSPCRIHRNHPRLTCVDCCMTR